MTTTTTMIAWTQATYGGPETVTRNELPVIEPGPGQILIDVAATALNSADVRLMRGEPLLVRLGFGLSRPKQPVQGRDVAGRVTALGDGVTGLSLGDRVAGELDGGGLAQAVLTEAAKVVAIPDNVSDVDAAAVPLAGGTAWQALEAAAVSADCRVLILGAGGGVGTFAVQLAKLRGARVHALSRPEAFDALTRLGADEVSDRAELGTLPRDHYDVIIDLGGVAPLRSLLQLLRDGGRLVSVAGGEAHVFGPLGRMLRGVVLSIGRSRKFVPLMATAKPEITRSLLELVASGRLTPLVAATLPLAQAPQALALVDRGGQIGKVVVAVDRGGSPSSRA